MFRPAKPISAESASQSDKLMYAFLSAVGEENYSVGCERVRESLNKNDPSLLTKHYSMVYLFLPCYEDRLDRGFYGSLTAPDFSKIPNAALILGDYKPTRKKAYLTEAQAISMTPNHAYVKSYPKVGITSTKLDLFMLLKEGRIELPALKKEEIDLSKNSTLQAPKENVASFDVAVKRPRTMTCGAN